MRLPLIVLALLLGVSGCAEGSPTYSQLNAITGALQFPNGSLCSGTKYWRHAIITTRHCLAGESKQVRFQGVLRNITRVLFDQQEGAIIIVDSDMGPSGARIGKVPKVGDKLWIIGNPIGIEQVIREDRLSWIGKFGMKNRTGETIWLHDCRCTNGDSGAGIFDDSGRLVGIHWGSIQTHWQDDERMPVEWYYPLAYPLAFTAEQWALAAQ